MQIGYWWWCDNVINQLFQTLLLAVTMLLVNIFWTSTKLSNTIWSGIKMPLSFNNSSQYSVSCTSFEAIFNLWIKSALLSDDCASRILAPIEVPDFNSWLANTKLLPACSCWQILTICKEKLNDFETSGFGWLLFIELINSLSNLHIGKLEKKSGQAPFIAPLNLLPLLRSRPGGVQKELVVKDLPVTKVTKFVSLYTQNATIGEFCYFNFYMSDYQLKWFFGDYQVKIALYFFISSNSAFLASCSFLRCSCSSRRFRDS